ncbi:helix-turn-helix domain-containing protein [Enterococcus sp. S22(2020)]|nr:helix-turn-helix domain-containing protein [Enterococcus sp. S22(2020)]
MSIPRTSLKRALDELNADFSEKNIPCQLKQDDTKKYYLVFDKDDSTLTIYHRLKLVYLKESLHFQLLSLLLTSSPQSIQKLSSKLVISPSYCYRIIRELNRQLIPFKLNISHMKKTENMEILGHEQTLRIFSFILLNEAYQTIEWPFHHISKNELTSSLHYQKKSHTNLSSPSKLNQVLFYMAITDLRIKNKKRLEKMDDELISMMNILKNNIDFLESRKYFTRNYHLNTENLTNEVIYFNAIFRILIVHAISPYHKQVAGEKIVVSQLNFSKNIITITNKLLIEFDLQNTKSIFYESVYFLSIYKIFITLINIDIGSLLKVSYNYPVSYERYNHVKLDAVTSFCEVFLKKNPSISSPLFSKKNYIFTCIILNTLLRIYSSSTLKIYFQFSKVFLGERLLSQMIENVFNLSTLQITTDFYQADLIISDSLDTVTDLQNKKCFYFHDVNDKKNWIELFQFIQLNLLASIDTDYAAIWKEYFI